MTSAEARPAIAVFLSLVASTFGAFFVAQNLKSAPAIVNVGRVQKFFSPNGDGIRDASTISFTVKEPDDVAVTIVDSGGDVVRRLTDGLEARAFRPVRLAWDGRTDAGARAPDGRYRVRVSLRRKGRAVPLPGPIILDTVAPRPSVFRDPEQAIVGPVAPAVKFRVRGISRREPTHIEVLRTDVDPPRTVAKTAIPKGRKTGTWNGIAEGRPAKPGTYLIVAKVTDRAGNVGSGPPSLPPRPHEITGEPGVTVRRLAVQAPVQTFRAGKVARINVDARGRPYRWSLRRVGRGRPAKESSSRDAVLTVRMPKDPSGLYLLQVRADRDRVEVPVLVQSPRRARILVVVPAITWLGLTEVDDGPRFDGVPNTLLNGGPVAITRVLPRLPAGVADEVAPLLVAMDRADISYDVTTDLELARSRDPRPTDREGVVLAASHRWLPAELGARLRRYVQDGGRLASFGMESLRAGVSATSRLLRRPTTLTAEDPFGHVLAKPRRRPRDSPPLSVVEDAEDIKLLEGTDGSVGGFELVEEAEKGPGERLKIIAALGDAPTPEEVAEAEAAGRLPREPLPVLSAGRLGKGLVFRVGLPQWASRIGTDGEVAQITRNILDLLRGVTPRPRSPL